MSRFGKWLPFFEESSERRDVASWDGELQKHLLDKFSVYLASKRIRIVGLVSDRAGALVKLGSSAYLNVCSMPDLFHFLQDIGKLGGLQIGKKHKKACVEKGILSQKQQNGASLSEAEQTMLKDVEEIIEVYKDYRTETRSINQEIHPFNNLNDWTKAEELNKNLLQSICTIGKLTERLTLNVDTSKATKILRQIPDIVAGVTNWLVNNRKKINDWVEDKVINEIEKTWFERFLLPAVYWEIQLERTKNGRKNPELTAHYQHKMEENQLKAIEFLEHLEEGEEISETRQEVLFEMAYQMAKSFQRSSSQVEGRNGYLAFIHHGQKRIPVNKKKALTIIHNFDTKRSDGSTPAQRLFGQEFPDLFEFLCTNVTGFKEPRKRKTKSFKVRHLQH